MQVHTTRGLIECDLLAVTDLVTYEPNARVIATEWRLGDELVRRDVWVSVLTPQSMNAEQEAI